MKRTRLVSLILLLSGMWFFSSDDLAALPRFAIDAGVSCQSCHVNPTGGGMRNEFGAEYYGRTVLPMRTYQQEQRLDGFSTGLNDFIRFGTDFRTLVFYIDSGNDSRSSFWQMQGDLYVSARVSRDLHFYLSKGLYQGFEIFGLLAIPSIDSYVKVGKFYPGYGLRMDDHIVYTRSGGAIPFFIEGIVPVPFGERPEDTGAEFGYDTDRTTLSVGWFSGNPGGGIRFADESINAVALRGEWRLISEGSTNGSIGGSLYRNKRSTFETINYGIFGGIGMERTFTLLGELMFVNRKAPPDAPSENYLLFFTEFNYLLRQGIDLKVQYNLGTGGTPDYTRHAIGVGAEFFFLPGLELRPLYRLHFSDDFPNVSEFILMFHIFI
jgi:hypothetical protein